jgi:hypothetical protein
MDDIRFLPNSQLTFLARPEVLTVDHRLDLGDFHDCFDIYGPKVTDTKRAAFQGTILDQVLKPSPELAKLPVRRDKRIMNEEKIWDESKLFDRTSNRLFDFLYTVELGLICCVSSVYAFVAKSADWAC